MIKIIFFVLLIAFVVLKLIKEIDKNDRELEALNNERFESVIQYLNAERKEVLFEINEKKTKPYQTYHYADKIVYDITYAGRYYNATFQGASICKIIEQP